MEALNHLPSTVGGLLCGEPSSCGKLSQAKWDCFPSFVSPAPYPQPRGGRGGVGVCPGFLHCDRLSRGCLQGAGSSDKVWVLGDFCLASLGVQQWARQCCWLPAGQVPPCPAPLLLMSGHVLTWFPAKRTERGQAWPLLGVLCIYSATSWWASQLPMDPVPCSQAWKG